MQTTRDDVSQPERWTIGQVARLTGLPAKTIRYYEESGILPPPTRAENGYRSYTRADLNRLHLLRRLHALGIAPSLIRDLLVSATSVPCAEVQREVRGILAERLIALDREIATLTALRSTLQLAAETLAECQSGDNVPFASCSDLSCVAPVASASEATAARGLRVLNRRECQDGCHEACCA